MTGVINGGFETGDFDRWEVGVITPQLELPIITTNAHSGVYGAMLKGGAFIQQKYTTPIKSVEYLQYWLRSAGADSLEVTVYFTKLTRSPHLLKGLFARGLGIQREEKDGWCKYVFKIPQFKPIWAIRFDCGNTIDLSIDDISFTRTKAKIPVRVSGLES
jgi:hypothetical protein